VVRHNFLVMAIGGRRDIGQWLLAC
jgi:hypothetical protein